MTRRRRPPSVLRVGFHVAIIVHDENVGRKQPDRHGGQRSNLNRSSGQAFDIETKQELHAFERQSFSAGAQSLVAAASLQGVVTATRSTLSGNQPRARPIFELLN